MKLSFMSGLRVLQGRGFTGEIKTPTAVRERNPPIQFGRKQPLRNEMSCEASPAPMPEDHVVFATHGSSGVVDLGGAKTMIGAIMLLR